MLSRAIVQAGSVSTGGLYLNFFFFFPSISFSVKRVSHMIVCRWTKLFFKIINGQTASEAIHVKKPQARDIAPLKVERTSGVFVPTICGSPTRSLIGHSHFVLTFMRDGGRQ